MRVLADYHHGCLYESLAILFEDRFGWELYRPTGFDWHQAGLWRYSADMRVVEQYLRTEAGSYRDRGTHHEWADTAHPGRVHKAVTLEQFRAMGRWDFVLASVTQHEAPYRQLAQESGARLVVQVGNVGQPVLDQDALVLCATSRTFPGLRALTYHPEFSLADYRREPPLETRRPHVANFVNCFPVTAGIGLWREVEALLPDFNFWQYGILGRDGIVGPCGEVARRMRESAFAWHDKPHGDGYGFVLHHWAACGRPLVGHAGYYRGALGGPLWEDGVTCVSLDNRTPAEAARLMQEAHASGRHAEMGRALRARFEEIVDFDQEAEAIRALLAA